MDDALKKVRESAVGVAVTTRRLPDSEHGFLVRRTGGWQEAEKLCDTLLAITELEKLPDLRFA